jgi:hypothetical protein
MPVNSRRKGATGERELFALLSDELGTIVKRRLDAPREGGADSLDVPGWSIECKRYARATNADITGWWLQTIGQTIDSDRKPVLIYRLDRQPWKVMCLATDAFDQDYGPHLIEMRLEFWCQIVREKMK